MVLSAPAARFIASFPFLASSSVILLFITPALSRGFYGVSHVLGSPNQLFGRQTGCTIECASTQQCCAGNCIDSDLTCCPDDVYWCTIVGSACEPCPAGLTCYTIEGDLSPWECCPNNVCTFLASSTTIVTSVSNKTPPSSALPTSTYTPPPTTHSPSPSPPPTTPTPSPSPTTPSPSPTPTPTTPSPSPSPTSSRLVTPPFITPTITPTLSTTSKSTSSKISSSSSVNPVTFITSTISPIQSTVSRWDGSGPLLTGTCATPEFSLVNGPQTTSVFYIGVVGCLGDKTDCCPFQVSSTTATVTAAGPAPTTQLLFPSASTSSQNTLPDCPADYETISTSYCCPSGYLLWDTPLGGITPCYSTTSNYLTPPPLTDASATDSAAPTGPSTTTSTVVNVVYAMNYPVKSRSTTLTKGADAGIGVGSAVAAAAAGSALLWFFIRRRRRNPDDEDDHSPWSDRRGRETGSSLSPGLVATPP